MFPLILYNLIEQAIVYLIVEGMEIMLIDLLISVMVTLALNLINYIADVDNAKPSPLVTN